jgi:hypothetical protein
VSSSVKQRDIGCVTSERFEWTSNNWATTSISKATYNNKLGRQKTVSEGHPRNPKSGKRIGGGPFFTIRESINPIYVPYGFTNPSNKAQSFRGSKVTPMSSSMLSPHQPSFAKFRPEDTSDLDPLGATAVSLCAPTNSAADLGVALGETAKDGIPVPGLPTWKSRTLRAKTAGSEFLNAVYGWLPLVKEVKEVGTSAKLSKEILDQYHKDENRNVHREFAFDDEHSMQTYSLGGFYPSSSLSGGVDNFPYAREESAPELTQTVETVTRRWFSGAFTYALPSSGNSWDGMYRASREADKLFGTELTPTLLWELTPWSWAVDWFSNAGEVINNVTLFGQQGLVMRYGYIMEEKSTTVTNSYSGRSGWKGLSGLPPTTYNITSKVRRPANPFGFGIGWEGLSPMQLAITAALGITRLR